MSFAQASNSDKELLHLVSEALFAELESGEDLAVSFRGENTSFLRWNQSKVRQNTSVQQKEITLELHKQGRRTRSAFSATGLLDQDVVLAKEILQAARKEIMQLPVDPYLVPMENHGTSDSEFPGELLPPEDVIAAIAKPAASVDLAGLYAGGSIQVGNRNSKGQSHWFANESFFMDYSLYNGERAAKSCYADTRWNQKSFEDSLRLTSQQLGIMNRPRKKLTPGSYRVYLAPAAVAEMTSMFSWGGFSYLALKNGESAFKNLHAGERELSPLFSLRENFGLGLTTRFNDVGELPPTELPIVTKGRLQNMLVNARTAREFAVPSNQASSGESFRALEILPGSLQSSQILKELDTGLYLSNLHYINWSDRPNARITGMTRYACLWVENGEILAPIEDMRFDVSFYDILGAGLKAVTGFQELDPAVDTYERRALGGKKLPGLLVEDFHFTL